MIRGLESKKALDATREEAAAILYLVFSLLKKRILTQDAIGQADRAIDAWLSALPAGRPDNVTKDVAANIAKLKKCGLFRTTQPYFVDEVQNKSMGEPCHGRYYSVSFGKPEKRA